MNKKLLALLPAIMLGFGVSAFAAPVTTTVADIFVGGQDNVTPARDVIGASDSFDIESMDVTIDRVTGSISVKIATEWFDPTGVGSNFGPGYDVNTGDLFISTNGWAPFGAAPHDGDDASNGESWEFVFDTSQGKIYGGPFGTLLSQDEMTGPLIDIRDGTHAYRNNQETRRSSGGNETGSGAVTWEYDPRTGDDIAYLTYSFLLSDVGLSKDGPINLGFHWTMTCGNDVIEGGVEGGPGSEVPEPGTVLLLGLGLLGFGLRRRAS